MDETGFTLKVGATARVVQQRSGAIGRSGRTVTCSKGSSSATATRYLRVFDTSKSG